MIEVIGLGLEIIWYLVKWFMGKAAEREAYAKEIAARLARIKKEGDLLAPLLLSELQRRSDVGWEDIPIRDPSSSGSGTDSESGSTPPE